MTKHKIQNKHIGYRPTWAEVDLGALAYNLRQIKERIAPKTQVLVCVKSDAYGHGLVPVSKKLVSLGIDYLGVASIDEGIVLRKAGITLPILVLGMILPSDIAPIFKYNLTQTVCTTELAVALNKYARRHKKMANIHIKVDTGMGRLGVLYREAFDFIKQAKSLNFLNVAGIYTHFPVADVDPAFTRHQIEVFNTLIRRLEKENIHIPLRHAANSMGIIGYKESHFNLVRPGLLAYGLYPKKNMQIKLEPVMSLKTKIVFKKRVPKGQGLSYGHTYRTKSDTTVVTIPIGYGDGYPRNLSNKAAVLIRGKRFRISGRVCMDQILIDVGDLRVKIAEEVILIGSSGRDRITAEELAYKSGTIPYEIVCGVGSRVPRIYK